MCAVHHKPEAYLKIGEPDCNRSKLAELCTGRQSKCHSVSLVPTHRPDLFNPTRNKICQQFDWLSQIDDRDGGRVQRWVKMRRQCLEVCFSCSSVTNHLLVLVLVLVLFLCYLLVLVLLLLLC